MKKRGQITAFIAVGIILIIIIGVFVLLREAGKEEQDVKAQGFEQQVNSVKRYAEVCIQRSAKNAVDLLGAMGSNVESPAGSFVREDSVPVSYLHQGTNNYLPAITAWEDDLTILVNLFALSCNFDEFTSQGLEIEAGSAISDVKIDENSVTFNVEYPVTVRFEGYENSFSGFSYVIPVKLGYIHNAIDEIIKESIENPGFIPTSKILEYDLNISTVEFIDENTLLYVIQDKDYYFLFADRYEG
ncbi:hypothetical protein KY330_04695 [Candidatus Woesearchaeota archaeon]|nr:hypothetical protein [Candidatus Woesearchaeota archaeon]